MTKMKLDAKLPLLQNADLQDKVALVRVDHNVVKKGAIQDPYRIEATIGTLFYIAARGGLPVLMTHVGRPLDKKTGNIKCSPENSVDPIVEYLRAKLHAEFHVPTLRIDHEKGITEVGESWEQAVRDLRARKFEGIYLPNTRWFQGEEQAGEAREHFVRQVAAQADLFVNDAFGSWQPHASTVGFASRLPSYAGFLLQQEIGNLARVIEPQRPFVGIVAGSKYDTKIGPLKALYEKADYLILGGVVYNAYLCAKYGVSIAGVSAEDVEAARELVETDSGRDKVVELPLVVESDTLEGRSEGSWRSVSTADFKPGGEYGYILDVDPASCADERVARVLAEAKTIFINAVMGFVPHFPEGSAALYRAIAANGAAMKLFGGGDTLQELKDGCPGVYLGAVDDPSYYFFTGGGAVLTAIEGGNPYALRPVEALMGANVNSPTAG